LQTAKASGEARLEAVEREALALRAEIVDKRGLAASTAKDLDIATRALAEERAKFAKKVSELFPEDLKPVEAKPDSMVEDAGQGAGEGAGGDIASQDLGAAS
jgi:hypothetical protein